MRITSAAERPMVLNGPPRARPILAIARVEAARLLRHPAFLVGLAGLAASFALQQLGGVEAWAGQNYYDANVAWNFVWVGALVAGALVAGRHRVLSDEELFPGTPATPGDRVLGTALGLLGPTVAAVAAVTVIAALTASEGGFVHGSGGYARRITPHPFEWLQPVLLVILAGVVGIAVVQLRRARLAWLLVAGLLTYFTTTAIWAFQAHPARVLHPFMFPAYERRLPESFNPGAWEPGRPPLTPPDEGVGAWRETRFDPTALGWHLVYLGGAILLGVWLATRMADRGERTSQRWLAIVGAALFLVGAVAQVVTAGVRV